MSLTPPAPQQMYIPPAAPPPAAPQLQPPQGSPGQFANNSNAGTASFMSSAVPAPANTGQRSLLGS